MAKSIMKRIDPETGEVKRRYVKRKLPFRQGMFTPVNTDKYVGDITKIKFRSSWELRIMMMLDKSDAIIKWSSEGTIIKYFSQTDNKERKYYSDFTIEYINDDGSTSVAILEIKPYKQIKPPKPPKRKTPKSLENYANAVITHKVNLDKWEHANNYCKNNNIHFLLVYQNKNNLFTFFNYDAYINGNMVIHE